MRIRIVDSSKKNIRDIHLSPRMQDVIVQRLQHVLDRETIIDRHQLASLIVERRMQRESQIDLRELARQLVDTRQQADGGNRNSPMSQTEETRVGQYRDRFKNIRVGERLPHAHKRDAVQCVAVQAEVQQLVGNFVGGQIPFQADGTGGAKPAPNPQPHCVEIQ